VVQIAQPFTTKDAKDHEGSFAMKDSSWSFVSLVVDDLSG